MCVCEPIILGMNLNSVCVYRMCFVPLKSIKKKMERKIYLTVRKRIRFSVFTKWNARLILLNVYTKKTFPLD